MPEVALPQSDTDALLDKMKREADKQRQYERFKRLCAVLQVSLFFGGFIYIAGWNHHAGGLISIVNIFGLLPQIVAKRLNSERRKNTVHMLTTINDVRIVGPLCDVLGFRDADMARIAQEALIEILPRLKSSDSHLLNREQRDRLYGTLSGDNRPLIFATLKALEQVGDERAIPFVDKLANGMRMAKTEENEVWAAANHCLPFLRERAAAQKASAELLRASSPETDNADLLRAASPQATQPQELLRASVNGGELT